MSSMKRLAGAAAAAALALSAALVGTGAANAVGHLELKADQATYMPGDTAKVAVTGCEAPNVLHAVVSIGDREKEMMDVTSPVSIEVPAMLGTYTVEALCVSYDDDTVLAEGKTTFEVAFDGIIFEPTRWQAGDKITLTAFGYKPNEKVTLTMVHKLSGKLVWTKAFGTADEYGVVSADVILKSDVKLGTYIAYLTGDDSGRKTSAEFYWGQPDDDSSKPGSGSSKPGIPGTGN